MHDTALAEVVTRGGQSGMQAAVNAAVVYDQQAPAECG